MTSEQWQGWLAYKADQVDEEESARRRGETLLEIATAKCPPRGTEAIVPTEWEGDVDFASLPASEWWDVEKLEAAS